MHLDKQTSDTEVDVQAEAQKQKTDQAATQHSGKRKGDAAANAGVEHGAMIKAGTRVIDGFEEPDRYTLKAGA